MEYIQNIRILYSDTDSYGVVWHGAYTKWFEAARVELVEKLGLKLDMLEKNNIIFPVVELNIRYKSSAKMNERIEIKTHIKEVKPVSITFEHNVYEKQTGILRVNAQSTIVTVNSETGKLYRKIPDDIYNKFLLGIS